MRQMFLLLNLFLSGAFVFAQTEPATTAITENATKEKVGVENKPSEPVADSAAKCVVEAEISGAIGPATLDFLQRAFVRVEKNNCGALFLLINTPGGNLQTTRLIVEEILASPVPVLCLVHPAGGHAGSAGAIILQACHLAGAVEATNIGAATPIAAEGQKLPDDLRNKLLNDTRSWVEGLAKLRGRNEKFARDIVDVAKAVSAKEALELKAIEFVGEKRAEFLKFADKKKINLNSSTEVTLNIGETIVFQQDLRFKVMDLLMNPQVAYLIFMGSIGLLYYELTHPGVIAPGVIGGLGLIISLVSLHLLDVTWGAVLLIILGIALMIAEAFVAGFGILGVGGIIAFFIGSLFLFDPVTSGYALPIELILPTSIVIGLLMIGIAYLAYSTRGRRRIGEFDQMIGRDGTISEVHAGDHSFAYMEIDGELWKCTASSQLSVGDKVKIKGHKGFTLEVDKST